MRSDLRAPIPLIQKTSVSGGQAEPPELRNGEHYEVSLEVYPTARGIFQFAIWARCRDGATEWMQPLVPDFRVMVLGSGDEDRFVHYIGVNARLQVSGTHRTLPAHVRASRVVALERMVAPAIPSGGAVSVEGRIQRASFYGGH